MGSLDFSRLVGVFIPGLTISIAVWRLMHRILPDAPTTTAIDKLVDREWLFTFVAVTAALFFGACLRSLTGLAEAKLLDRCSRRRLKIDSAAQFDLEWDYYVDSLETTNNSYIEDLALSFFFDLREGVALLFLSIVLAAGPGCALRWVSAIPAFASIALLYSAAEGHFTLAERRHRLFGEKARQQIETQKK